MRKVCLKHQFRIQTDMTEVEIQRHRIADTCKIADQARHDNGNKEAAHHPSQVKAKAQYQTK